MKQWMTVLLLASVSGLASGKLPPPSDEAKAKAAEAAAKAAWGDKVGAYQLCVVMDKVAARYLADAAKAGKSLQPTATPPCADPGPFAYAPPAPAKPLEAAGAHSPAATAVSPPSGKTPSAELAPAKKP
jgi:hypothetical protein